MIRIALCDDDKNDMLLLHREIVNWYQENNIAQSISVSEFSDSSYLAREIKAGSSFDIFFLDVEMPKLDGIRLAELIHNSLPAAIIIFSTSHSELAPEGYRSRALRYIPKMKFDSRLSEALEAAQKEYALLETGCLIVPHYSDALKVLYREIIYVRHVLRSTQIVTAHQGIIKDNRGLKEIYGLINDERFIFIERSTFVNLDYVREIRGNEIILRGGDSLPVSRPMLPKVKETIIRMWR